MVNIDEDEMKSSRSGGKRNSKSHKDFDNCDNINKNMR